jgi:hypothetical protein
MENEIKDKKIKKRHRAWILAISNSNPKAGLHLLAEAKAHPEL